LYALEQLQLGFDHAEVGSLLAEKWKLPPQIVECTRRHHRPETAEPSFAGILRLVALGTDAAAVLTLANPRARLDEFLTRAADWFAVKREEGEQLLSDIAEGASQLSSLLEIGTGVTPDVTQILAEANDQLTTHQLAVEQEADQLQRSNQELARQAITDALTGCANRKHFDTEIERLFALMSSGGPPVSVLFSDADRFKSVNDAHGHQAGDVVLVELADRMRQTIGAGGTVCRYGGEEFAVILPACGLDQAIRIAESIRLAVQSTPIRIRTLSQSAAELPITISVGVASTERERFESAAQLVHAADDAVYAAKNAGRNCVKLGTRQEPALAQRPRTVAAEARAGAVAVLLIEPDALAAKLIELMFAKRSDAQLRVATSTEDALRMMLDGPSVANPVDVVLCSLGLPGLAGVGLIRTLRADPKWQQLPIVALATHEDRQTADACRAAGASLFITKAKYCSNLARWTSQVLQLGAEPRRNAA
jgi:diguanylate cyclase (GGDEF)-like protein